VSHTHGTDSEVGRLRSVIVHRPGPELRKITPRSRERLQFDGLPWVSRAQEEHDLLAQVLRDHGAEVLYVTELLQDALEYQGARDEAIGGVLDISALGQELRQQVRDYLESLAPEPLCQVLIAGLTPGELKSGHGVVFELLDRHEFIIEPLPNLAFSRDSSVWIGDRVAVTSLRAPERMRECQLMNVIYRHHPRFAGTKPLYAPGYEPVHGGDVLLLAPGVAAVGVGQQSTAAGLERLARNLFEAGLVHTVLAVPIDQGRTGAHLDTLCTVVDAGWVIMHPALAFTLRAHAIGPRGKGLRVSPPRPFLEAAAQAIGIDRVKIIGTGLDPLTGPRQQWDDGGNALALGRRVVVCHERNVETNARLQWEGIEVIRVPGSELASRRGGPRSMCCPVARDPAAQPDPAQNGYHEPRRDAHQAVLAGPVPAAAPVPAGNSPRVPAQVLAR
jgi:arginine deiminase